MTDYKNSPAWLKAMDLAEEISRVTKTLAKTEDVRGMRMPRQHPFNLEAERIVFDIATAEGRKALPQEYLRFMLLAQGTTFRLESRLLLDVRRGYIEQSNVAAALKLCGELGELLNTLTEKLAADERTLRLNRQIRPIDFQPEL